MHHIEAETFSLFVELQQIPGIIIVYRRPSEREANPEKVSLDSRQLRHIPLLEGEEKIKFLNIQNKSITKIENLVSLPNLHFLDLSQNKLSDFGNLSSCSLMNLRVLILSKNHITNINAFNSVCQGLSNLDVLDLHDNRITGKLDLFQCGISKLPNLRILNFSNNLLEFVSIPTTMKSLVEINLRNNKIKDFKVNSLRFEKLNKIYLSNNFIQSFDQVSKEAFVNVTQLTFENNPVERHEKLQVMVADKFPKVNLPAKTMPIKRDLSKEKLGSPKGGITAAKRKAQENQVIKIIQKEWERETERLDLKKNGVYAKNQNAKNLGDKSLVQSGHAEIESNKVLYIYGNALEVLARSEFYDVVEEMHLTYVRFDLIVYHPNLDKLRKFTKLKKLVLSHNYLNSFILLSKIECLHSLDQLFIYDNEILQAQTLNSFIVYRFQHIAEFNGILINDHDKKVAKTQFQLFDKILSVQNIFTRKPPSMQTTDPVKRQEVRQLQKKHQEIAHVRQQEMVQEVIAS